MAAANTTPDETDPWAEVQAAINAAFPRATLTTGGAGCVRNKGQMDALFVAGAFGNRPVTWPSVDAFLASGFDQPVGLFQRDPKGVAGRGGRRAEYRIPPSEVPERLKVWLAEGIQYPHINVTEMMNHRHNVLQGELRPPARYPSVAEDCDWQLSYSCTLGLTMREAIAQGLNRMGGYSRLLLRQLMDRGSYDNLLRLVEQYPGHVIEFSIFSRRVGVQHLNTIFWEVRDY